MATDGLRRWSANNRLLALLQLQERAQQRPELMDDVHMMSFRQWDKEHGRKVIKGERAIWILAPRTRRVEEEGADGSKTSRTIVTGFTAVPVFNITQTQGPDLPRSPIRPGNGEVPPGVLTGLRDRVAAAVDAAGLAGLVPARPGPRRAHKLTDEVVEFARQARAGDPAPSWAELAASIADRFGVSVHPRSVERAVARAEYPKSGDR